MEIKACVFDVDHARRELQDHGTPEFPCAGYETLYTAGPDGDIRWHWHEDLELWHVLEGQIELRAPGRVLTLRAGDCAAVNRNVLHAGDTKSRCRLRSLAFNAALVSGGADTVFARRYLRPLTACAAFDACALGAEERQAFEEAFSALSTGGEGFEFTVRESLSRVCLALFERFAPQKQESAPPGLDGERLRAMLAFLHENYERPIQLCEVARAANVSPRECLRCFRRAMQTPPNTIYSVLFQKNTHDMQINACNRIMEQDGRQDGFIVFLLQPPPGLLRLLADLPASSAAPLPPPP